ALDFKCQIEIPNPRKNDFLSPIKSIQKLGTHCRLITVGTFRLVQKYMCSMAVVTELHAKSLLGATSTYMYAYTSLLLCVVSIAPAVVCTQS
ncbi:unnamed protein product, partial [Amoebophrya sp. A25]